MLRPANKLNSTLRTAALAHASATWRKKNPRSFGARSTETTLTRSRCGRAKIICRRCARSSNCANAASQCASMTSILLGQQNFHEIAPPVDYSFVPTWAIFVASFVGLCLVGLTAWFVKRIPKPALPPKTPSEIALEERELICSQSQNTTHYQ